jgi:hypothetical protein
VILSELPPGGTAQQTSGPANTGITRFTDDAQAMVKKWAEFYRSQGFALARIAICTKQPNYEDWTLRSAEPDEFLEYDQLGIMAGSRSGDLAVVDLDSEKALELADKFLPQTPMVSGREGKPWSHRFFSRDERSRRTYFPGGGGYWWTKDPPLSSSGHRLAWHRRADGRTAIIAPQRAAPILAWRIPTTSTSRLSATLRGGREAGCRLWRKTSCILSEPVSRPTNCPGRSMSNSTKRCHRTPAVLSRSTAHGHACR